MNLDDTLWGNGGGNEVKGGLVINQLRDYAKRYAKHIGKSACVELIIWNHPTINGTETISLRVWDSAAKKWHNLRPHHCNDIRNLGKLIDELIEKQAVKNSNKALRGTEVICK